MSWLKKRVFRQRPKQLILLYHHIAEMSIDPWEMAVKPAHFTAQLDVLTNDYKILPLSELSQNRQSTERIIYLTFDDAYLDNYVTAFPVLRKHKLPATFFVATQILDGDCLFWWDILEDLLLGNQQLPGQLKFCFGDGRIFEKTIPAPAHNTGKWSAWSGTAQSERQQIYLELVAMIKECTPDEQQNISRQLLSWAGADSNISAHTSKMTEEQLREVFDSGLVNIGAHSVHHPALGGLPEALQQDEILESRQRLEELVKMPVRAFAYPHGHYNPLTKSLLSKNGFDLACTTEENAINRHSDLLALPRLWVRDWDKDHFGKWLKKWLQKS